MIQNEKTKRSPVPVSLLLTAVIIAAVLFFGLRYANSEPPVFFAAALIAAVSAALTDHLPRERIQNRMLLLLWSIPAVILGGFMLLSMCMGYPAGSKRESEQAVARQIVFAADTALADMEAEGCPLPESPYIVQCGQEPEPDSLAARISQYDSDVARGTSYALILKQTDDGIRTAGVYWAPFSVLTPDTLNETPREEQIRQLGRLFRQSDPVFYETAGTPLSEND
ncbi:MAG: hypothetical protein IKX57_04330 [Oscillospiraceae bacterium]|nr:hypothetical protein [Oscillospiraceae bacterium]